VCARYASRPPKVYNSDKSAYYGELTLYQTRADAINHAVTVAWLELDVCNY